MYAPWEICGLPCEVQVADTNVNASCSCGYIIILAHNQKVGKAEFSDCRWRMAILREKKMEDQ